MDLLSWMDFGAIGAGMSSVNVPSIGHFFALLTLVGLWKSFPRVYAFDPYPQSSSESKALNPIFTPPSPPPSLPQHPPPKEEERRPSARALSEWETDSSCDSLPSTSLDQSCHSQSPPQPDYEPSHFLRSQAPESTSAERLRFLVARGGNEEKALENLHKYLAWRDQFGLLQRQQEDKYFNLLDEGEDPDLYDWIVASQTALHATGQAREGWQWLPRIVQTHRLSNGQTAVDYDGVQIVHITPAKIDDQICSLEAYSLAIALYMDRKFPRDSVDKMTLLMDLRPGDGWRNISAVRLLPFIKSIVGLMLTMFPERLYRSVLYPLPYAFSWVFNAVKAVIDPVTAKKIVVLSGSAGMKSPMPIDSMTQYISREVALLCEKERLASFSC